MRSYLTISGTIFGLVTLLHLGRLLRHWPVVLNTWPVPLWISAIGLVVAGSLGLWAFRLVRGLSGQR